MELASAPILAWAPQPGPQELLVSCPFREILFGGARGGGKTDACIGRMGLRASTYGARYNGVFLRRELTAADDLIERAKQVYEPLGAKWKEQKNTFVFPGGGRIRFRPLDNVADTDKYQGQNVSEFVVEEAGQYPSSEPIDRLLAALRGGGRDMPKSLILTANPGGVGHGWIKARYISPAPPMVPHHRIRADGQQTRHQVVYIPSLLRHNKILVESDPDYEESLHLVGSAALVRAWLNGDWSVIAGQYFTEWEDWRHVVLPEEVPEYEPGMRRWRCLDWGTAKPFACLWLMEDFSGNVWVYRELYGDGGKPNVGNNWTARMVAKEIRRIEQEAGENPASFDESIADSNIFPGEGGDTSIADVFAEEGIIWEPVSKGRASRVNGWNDIRQRLRAADRDFDSRNAIYFSSDCKHTIRTMVGLQHNPNNAEDVDTDGEDHAPDALRYGLSRIRIPPKRPRAKRGYGVGAHDYLIRQPGQR